MSILLNRKILILPSPVGPASRAGCALSFLVKLIPGGNLCTVCQASLVLSAYVCAGRVRLVLSACLCAGRVRLVLSVYVCAARVL